MSEYNADYYERGNELGISGYSHYRWMPELTIPMAYTIIRHLNIEPHETILDFGCAKGYLVHAFRLLHHKAWGYDISDYALGQAPQEVKQFIGNKLPDTKFDWIIAKDVFEHIEYKNITRLLKNLRPKTKKLFCVVPLGNGKKYTVPSYNNDITHRIKENAEWWMDTFEKAGYGILEYNYRVQHLKENYAQWEHGNLFLSVRA
jgi:SAM-dependent methyltransferase